MRTLPLSIGTIHFVGIGGIGMSGIAEVLHNLGYQVQGSDVADNANVQRLRQLGIKVAIGHNEDNLGDVQVVVASSAIRSDNPEIVAARKRLIAVVRRAEMLAELMRLKWSVAVAGTHGKTTTTSLVAALFDAAGLDPTVINGGIINAWSSNARLGNGDWMVVEADESDGTFVKLPAVACVVTNIDPEHLDHYGDFESLRRAFTDFAENIPFYGVAVMCVDHPEVQTLISRVRDRKIITYGLSPQADVRALNVRSVDKGVQFSVEIIDRVTRDTSMIEDLFLPMKGRHNVQNALAAVALSQALELDGEVVRKAFAEFAGVKRRFTWVGEVDGITVIDDYGHHPVEIAAVLSAARDSSEGKVIAVFQPHRYSRVNDLFDDFCTCFNDADVVLVSEIYAAGEEPIAGISRDALVEGMFAHGHRQALALESPDAIAGIVNRLASPGDLVVCLGAGSVTQWAAALPEQLQALRPDANTSGRGEGER